MTNTVYVPVLIKTVEQAEALAEGTLVIDMTPGDPYAWRKSGGLFIDHIGGTCEATPEEIAGFSPTAFVAVPATVERQWVETYPNGGRIRFSEHPGSSPFRNAVVSEETRYTTPWAPEEEA